MGKSIDYDWKVVPIFVKFLKLFYEITIKFFDSLYVTSNDFCQDVFEVNEQLDEMCDSENIMLRGMTSVMKLEYQKYWEDVSRMNI